MKLFINDLFVWIFVLSGVGVHVWFWAWKSKNSLNPRTCSSILEYLQRYAPVIVIRTLVNLALYGLWFTNPDSLLKMALTGTDKLHQAGWDKLAWFLSALPLSPRNIFVALLYGLSADIVLFALAKYVPMFKEIVPDLPSGQTRMMTTEEVESEIQRAKAANAAGGDKQ